MKILFCILSFLVFSSVSGGQDQYSEQVFLFSDRNLYISGEEISFSAILISQDPNAVSNVLYVELITPGGTRIAGGKFFIDGSVAASTITVPAEVITGNYFLRAYTRFMRNNPYSFIYQKIKIVNPYRNIVIAPGSDTSSFTENKARPENDVFRIRLEQESFARGDTVHAVIGKEKNDSVIFVSVSVIPADLPEDSLLLVNKPSDEPAYYDPEKDGVFLTGTVKDSGGNPAYGIRVNLSVLGKGRDFMAAKTDSGGHFFFYLRGFEGRRDLFLSTEKSERSMTIMIDNDFSAVPVSINAGLFSLSEEERNVALKMARNCKVDSVFGKKEISKADTAILDEFFPFYGTPDEVINIDSYVQLPTLEEYFNGLPTLVKVRRKGTQKYFKVLGNQTELTGFDPLVLIDLVAIDDPERILGINPRDLKRIEIINSVYVKGDQLYGGIISLISRKGDFAGINLPESGLFVPYSFPERRKIQKSDFRSGVPDTRNTVLWIPDLKISDEKEIYIITPATPGNYEILVRGVRSDLKLFSVRKRFEVQ